MPASLSHIVVDAPRNSIEIEWPSFGKPEFLISDNGPDFNARHWISIGFGLLGLESQSSEPKGAVR